MPEVCLLTISVGVKVDRAALAKRGDSSIGTSLSVHPCLSFKVKGQTVQTGEVGNSDTLMDRWTLPIPLSPCFVKAMRLIIM